MDPREILENTRRAISEHAGDDPDKWFYTNRFVFARLQLDERKIKTQVKKELLEAQKPCGYCGKSFEGTADVHLHRVDGERGYSLGNCALMHRECHTKYHAENPAIRRGRGRRAGKDAGPVAAVLEKESKRYDGRDYIYWWDISPGFLKKTELYEAVEFIKKDTGERCHVPVVALKGYLTKDRQTSRGQGNWGIRVLTDREGELAFEPANRKSRWLFLPVVWLSDKEED